MLVCIEGADGCGKDSVANAVADLLGGERLNFPNDAGVTGPMIRSYLRREWVVAQPGFIPPPTGGGLVWLSGSGVHEKPVDWSALAFQALQVTNRMEVMPRLLEVAATTDDPVVVLARYWQSAWVYGQLDGLDPDWLVRVHEAMAQPHVNVLLDVPAETCMARRAVRDGAAKPELYEGKLEFTRRVVELYRKLWRDHPTPASRYGRWVRIDATVPLGNVVSAVRDAILEV